ncbi:MAG: ABC transporter permease [Gemmatimonadetes bacterium]|nr:ABC transporter permease [Gemmatimonadota bacterium]
MASASAPEHALSEPPKAREQLPAVRRRFVHGPLASCGRLTLSALVLFGRAWRLFWASIHALREVGLWGPLLLPQMARVGVASVPIAVFIAIFTGIVMSLQASYTLSGTLPLYFVGTMVGKSMIIELGPVLTGLVLAGRVGATISAELGTMRVTEQIDALETLAYDPVVYLVIPRTVAGIVMFPLVVLIATSVGIGSAWVTALELLNMSSAEFVKGLRLFFEPWDVWFAVIKTISFGAIVTGVGCFFGLQTDRGARGVGRATTRTVVVASMCILVLDAFWAAVLL